MTEGGGVPAQQEDHSHKDEDSEHDGEECGDRLEDAGVAECALRSLLFGFHEQGEFLFQGNDCVFILELHGEPWAGVFGPGFGKPFQNLGCGRLETGPGPKRGALGCPKPEDAVIGGEGFDAFDEQGSDFIGEGEVLVRFVMEPAIGAVDLDADGADDMPGGGFDDLEFREPLFQIIGGKPHRGPQAFQSGEVIQRSAPNAVGR